MYIHQSMHVFNCYIYTHQHMHVFNCYIYTHINMLCALICCMYVHHSRVTKRAGVVRIDFHASAHVCTYVCIHILNLIDVLCIYT